LQSYLSTATDEARSANLIVSATGSWAAESALNRWHTENGRQMPIVYGWTEAHACAGHAVVIAGDGGCLQCDLGRTGVPNFTIVEWPDGGGGNTEEPACGAHYQPYGPIELGFITATIGETVLDCLLGRISRSKHRMFATSPSRVGILGGRWTEAWLATPSSKSADAVTHERDWPAHDCIVCRPAVTARVSVTA
jgi:hypothetical protein